MHSGFEFCSCERITEYVTFCYLSNQYCSFITLINTWHNIDIYKLPKLIKVFFR
jgi:hypothetical protein